MTYMSYCEFVNFYLLISKSFYYKDLQDFRSDINSAKKLDQLILDFTN